MQRSMQTGMMVSIAALTAGLLVAGAAGAVGPSPEATQATLRALSGETTELVPEAEVWISNPQPRVEEPFFVEVELRWAGGADRLLPHPPHFKLPESWKAGALAASTRKDDGWSVVLYRLDLTAFEPGTFRLEPLQVRWTAHGASSPASLPTEIPEVTVTARPTGLASPPSAAGSSESAPPVGGAVIVVLLLATGAILLRRLRSRVRIFSEDRDRRSEHARARHEELLRQATRLRQDGHPAEAVYVFGQILRELDAEGPVTARRLEEIRYGGNPPRTEELEGLESRVRRELEARTPRPERADEPPQRHGMAVPSAVQSMD